MVEPSKKLILSINADTSVNKLLKFKNLPDTLSNYEASLINKYMISVVDNFGFKQAAIINNDQFILGSKSLIILDHTTKSQRDIIRMH